MSASIFISIFHQKDIKWNESKWESFSLQTALGIIVSLIK